MSEPLKKQFSKEELIEIASKWMREESGYYKTFDNPDRYFENLGLLVNFISDLFEK